MKFFQMSRCYLVDGVEYPRCTTILDETLERQGLIFWKVDQAIHYALTHRKATEREIKTALGKVSRDGAERGSNVHDWIKRYTPGKEKYLKRLPPSYRGYCEAYVTALKELRPTVVYREKTMISKRHGFGCTMDQKWNMANGQSYVIDVKTGTIVPRDAIQLAANKAAAMENGLADATTKTGLLKLHGDGRYEWIPVDVPFDLFLSVKQLWDWKQTFRTQVKEVKKLARDAKKKVHILVDKKKRRR